MEKYDKLVEALRCCDEYALCNDCPIFETCDGDVDKAMAIAADAIEGLNRLVDLNTERCEGLREQLRKAQEQYEKHLNELEQQLPKRGEIVRCKECRWGHLCVTGQHLGLDGFCSKGEREVQE